MIIPEDRQMAVKLLDEALAQGARLKPACKILGISARTIQRWKAQRSSIDQRTQRSYSPTNKLSEQERQDILDVANEPQYSDLPPSQIVPRLADEGAYIASESSFYRVLRQARQLQPRGTAKPRTPSPPPKGYRANGACQVWSWDITYLRTVVAGQFFYLYLILDIYSRKIVGWEVHDVERSEYGAELLKRAILAEGISGSALAPVLHSDNGSPMKGATMLATMQALGVMPSFSRPSVSNDNPFSESLFRTLKGCPKWPEGAFESLDDARQWVYGFVQWYNYEHRHSGIGFVTPVQRHKGEDKEIFIQRKSVYERAKKRKPERWSGSTRNWSAPTDVWLNPPANIQ